MHDESLYALRAMRAGAEGYVMKHEAMPNVVQAIHEVFNGRPYLSPAMAAQVITKFAHRQAEGESGRRRETERPRTGNSRVDRQRQRSASDREAVASQPQNGGDPSVAHQRQTRSENSREVARFALQWLQARGGVT